MNCQADPNIEPLKGKDARNYIENTLGYPLDVLQIFPKFFLIEPINVCNARCVMCGIDFTKKKKAAMADLLFEKITDEISQYKEHVEKVMLYLDCEPLLDKTLHLKIRKMKKAGVKKVNIATNASLLNSQRSVELIDAGLDEVYFTVDSLNKDTFEDIRCGLKFEQVYNNVVNFIQLRNKFNPRIIIRVQMILQDLNYDESNLFIDHWTRILNKHDQVVMQKAHNWASAVNVMRIGDEGSVNAIPCIAIWGTLAVHMNGDVGLCCLDTNSSILLGNLNSQTIAEIWSGIPLDKIRQKHLEGKRNEIRLCDGCTLWRKNKSDFKKIIGLAL